MRPRVLWSGVTSSSGPNGSPSSSFVRVFDSAGAEAFAFELGMGKIYSLAVSPDGMTFANIT